MKQRKQQYGFAARTIVMAILCMVSAVVWADADPGSLYENKVKAAYLVKFIPYIEGWRFEKAKDANRDKASANDQQIVLGIIGNSPFGDLFDIIKNKRVKNRTIRVVYFKGLSALNDQGAPPAVHPEADTMKTCDVIFICSSEALYMREILRPLQGEAILTVSDTENTRDASVIINFVTKQHKVFFDINRAAARQAQLTFRAKLLRLARRVIEADNPEQR